MTCGTVTDSGVRVVSSTFPILLIGPHDIEQGGYTETDASSSIVNDSNISSACWSTGEVYAGSGRVIAAV
jgi:hypothetical protein